MLRVLKRRHAGEFEWHPFARAFSCTAVPPNRLDDMRARPSCNSAVLRSPVADRPMSYGACVRRSRLPALMWSGPRQDCASSAFAPG